MTIWNNNKKQFLFPLNRIIFVLFSLLFLWLTTQAVVVAAMEAQTKLETTTLSPSLGSQNGDSASKVSRPETVVRNLSNITSSENQKENLTTSSTPKRKPEEKPLPSHDDTDGSPNDSGLPPAESSTTACDTTEPTTTVSGAGDRGTTFTASTPSAVNINKDDDVSDSAMPVKEYSTIIATLAPPVHMMHATSWALVVTSVISALVLITACLCKAIR
ncbi:hypothetical protein Ahia01_000967400 [Argonauta hians]